MKDIIYELGQVALKTIWLAVAAAGLVGVLRLCAWADTGTRGDGSEIQTTILP